MACGAIGKNDLDWSKPFVLSKADECLAPEDIQKAIKGFVAVFKDSSIRVTEGRAQAPVQDQIAESFAKGLGSKMASAASAARFILSLNSQERTQNPELFKAMCTSTFGVAGSQISIAKFELHMLPCLRVTYQGTRFITVILLGPVMKHLEKDAKERVTVQQLQEYLFSCTAADLTRIADDGGAFCATVGPNDIVYLPPGSIVSHKVMSQDVSGFKVGILNKCMTSEMDLVHKLCPENAAVKQALQWMKKAPEVKMNPHEDDAKTKREEEEAARKEREKEAKKEQEAAEEFRKEEAARKEQEAKEREEAARKEQEAKEREEAARKEQEAKEREEAARKEQEAKEREEAARKEQEAKEREEAAKKEQEAKEREEAARKKQEAKEREEANRKEQEGKKEAQVKAVASLGRVIKRANLLVIFCLD
eukprot:s7745_g3.t1